MKFIVLNGSPKGETSVTMQYINFLARRFPQHEWKIIPVAFTVRKLEREQQAYADVIDQVSSADGVIWAFPLYILHVHAAYKRFIELVEEHGSQSAFAGKYAAALSTSIKFFDHTAHEYIHGICDDWGMKYVGFYSAHMTDLYKQPEQQRLLGFAENFLQVVADQEPVGRVHPPIDNTTCITYQSGPVVRKTPLGDKRAVIVTDALEPGTSLYNLIQHTRESFQPAADLVNLSEISIKGGCLGCLHCGFNNVCVYDGQDDVRPTYERLQQYDIVIYAGAVRDRYLSSRWKQFYDRRFFNTHQPIFVGKQLAFCLSGPLQQIPNLRHILTSFVQFDGSNVGDFITDEAVSSEEIDAQIEAMAARLVRQAELSYVQPMSAPAVTGRMVFRDHIWGSLRFVFQGDHRYYRQHGWYDFPQRDWRMRLVNALMIPFSHIPSVKRQIQQNMKSMMIQGYQRVK